MAFAGVEYRTGIPNSEGFEVAVWAVPRFGVRRIDA